VISRKFIILKGGIMQENKDPRVFCNKISPNDRSSCEDFYHQQLEHIEINADGGPFNTSLESVINFMEQMQEDISPIDKIE
jgi:hypothetical protein